MAARDRTQSQLNQRLGNTNNAEDRHQITTSYGRVWYLHMGRDLPKLRPHL